MLLRGYMEVFFQKIPNRQLTDYLRLSNRGHKSGCPDYEGISVKARPSLFFLYEPTIR